MAAQYELEWRFLKNAKELRYPCENSMISDRSSVEKFLQFLQGGSDSHEYVSPISFIFLYRLKPSDYFPGFTNDNLENPYFLEMRCEEKDIIDRFDELMESGLGLKECLKMIKFKATPNIEFFEFFHELEKTNIAILYYLYNIMALMSSEITIQNIQLSFDIIRNLTTIHSQDMPSQVDAIFVDYSLNVRSHLNDVKNLQEWCNLCIDYILQNKRIGNFAFPLITNLVETSVQKLSWENGLAIISRVNSLFQARLPCIRVSNYRKFIDAFFEYKYIFDDQNNSPMVIAIASCLTDKLAPFEEYLVTIPNIIVQSIRKEKPIVNAMEILKTSAQNLVVTSQSKSAKNAAKLIDEGLTLPLQLVEPKFLLSELVPRHFLPVLARLTAFCEQLPKTVSPVFVKAMAATIRSCAGTEIGIDLVAISFLLTAPMIGWDVSPVLSSIACSDLFAPGYTIFMKQKFDETMNCLRNEFFVTAANELPKSILLLFDTSRSNPLLIAEHICRLMKHHPPLTTEFMASDLIVSQVVSANSSLGVIRTAEGADLSLARSSLLVFIFNLMDDDNAALMCLSSSVFSTGFLTLLIDEGLTSTVLFKIRNAISKFEKLPPSLLQFIIFVLKHAAGLIKNLSDDSDVTEARTLLDGVSDLSQAIIDTLKGNSKLIEDYITFYDSLIETAEITKSPKLVQLALSLVTVRNNEVNESMFGHERMGKLTRTSIDILGCGHDSVVTTFVNIMGRSSSLAKGTKFLIKNSFAVPYLLFAFDGGNADPAIEMLAELCAHSNSNFYHLRKCETAAIIMKMLRGEVTYKNRTWNPIIEHSSTAIKLTAQLLNYDCSDHEIQVFIDFMDPRKPTDLSEQLAHCYFEENDHDFRRHQFTKTVGNEPCFQTVLNSYDILQHHYVFSILLKIDVEQLCEIDDDLHIICMEDRDESMMSVFIRGKSIYVKSLFGRTKASLLLGRDVLTSEETLITIYVTRESGLDNIGLYMNSELLMDGQFPYFDFQGPVTLKFVSFENKHTFEDMPLPVNVGSFVLFSTPTPIIEFNFENIEKQNGNILFTQNNIEPYCDRRPLNEGLNTKECAKAMTNLIINLKEDQSSYAMVLLVLIVRCIPYKNSEFLSLTSLLAQSCGVTPKSYELLVHIASTMPRELKDQAYHNLLFTLSLFGGGSERSFSQILHNLLKFVRSDDTLLLEESFISQYLAETLMVRKQFPDKSQCLSNYIVKTVTSLSQRSIKQNDVKFLVSLLLVDEANEFRGIYARILLAIAQSKPSLFGQKEISMLCHLKSTDAGVFLALEEIYNCIKTQAAKLCLTFFAVNFYENGGVHQPITYDEILAKAIAGQPVNASELPPIQYENPLSFLLPAMAAAVNSELIEWATTQVSKIIVKSDDPYKKLCECCSIIDSLGASDAFDCKDLRAKFVLAVSSETIKSKFDPLLNGRILLRLFLLISFGVRQPCISPHLLVTIASDTSGMVGSFDLPVSTESGFRVLVKFAQSFSSQNSRARVCPDQLVTSAPSISGLRNLANGADGEFTSQILQYIDDPKPLMTSSLFDRLSHLHANSILEGVSAFYNAISGAICNCGYQEAAFVVNVAILEETHFVAKIKRHCAALYCNK